jgi:transmembrane sensor
MKEELIIAYLNSDCSPEEKKRVEAWINDAPENTKHLNELKFIWDNARSDFSGIPVNSESSWSSIQEAITKEKSQGGILQRGKVRNMSGRTFLRIAASIVFLISIGYLSVREFSSNRTFHSELVSVETTSESSEVELPDGTLVWLNDNTTLSYPEKFRSNSREIKISGEAFFDVKKSKRKPFIVETDNARVEVLGTSFNVNSDAPGKKVIVTVVTGRVSFSNINDQVNKIILEPGEQGTFTPFDGRLQKSENSDNNFLAWKTGILVFENESLTGVCSLLSEHYNLTVGMDNQDLLESKMLSATFNNKELEEVVSIIAMTLDVSFRYEGGRIIFFPNN